MPLAFKGHGTAIDDTGFADALETAQIEAAALWAVLAIETSGVGFFPDRRPKILFERHVFSRQTDHEFDDSHPDISSPAPGNYGATGDHQYDRLNAAMALAPVEALRSTSWGLGQVMGFNYAATNSTSVEQMIERMVRSESQQLACTIDFMFDSGCIKHLRSKSWDSFAACYNGPNYAVNNYDGRLKATYYKYINGGMPVLRVRTLQSYLIFLGYQPGIVDGVLGKFTRDAMNMFQAAQGLPATPFPDTETMTRLTTLVNALPV